MTLSRPLPHHGWFFGGRRFIERPRKRCALSRKRERGVAQGAAFTSTPKKCPKAARVRNSARAELIQLRTS